MYCLSFSFYQSIDNEYFFIAINLWHLYSHFYGRIVSDYPSIAFEIWNTDSFFLKYPYLYSNSRFLTDFFRFYQNQLKISELCLIILSYISNWKIYVK